MKYSYKTGQRVLNTYTIKRGLGTGAFGQVYLATSDMGKEVALKLLNSNGTKIEIRGVLNCLNLKHPNLVHVYDVKTEDNGDTWVIMEFVLGNTLAQEIDQNKHGLPIPKVQSYFKQLAQALTYLHESGVVHRDLKPANIFIEHGQLKLGDYGLSKTVSSRGGESRRVGTCHYMAPEISTGNYNRSIDIYAVGIMLHEMLTGKVPFDGESEAEILMKHLHGTPDLSKAPKPFVPVLEKVLAKSPDARYATMQEFATAVDQACEQAMASSSFSQPAMPTPLVPPFQGEPTLPRAVQVVERNPILLPETTVAKPVTNAANLHDENKQDSFCWRDHLTNVSGGVLLTPAIVAVMLTPYSLFVPSTEWSALAKIVLLTTLAGWSFLLVGLGRSFRSPDAWWPRIRFALAGAALGVVAFRLDGWNWPEITWDESNSASGITLLGMFRAETEPFARLAKYVLYFAAIYGAGRWWRTVAIDRKERLSSWPPIAATILGWVLVFLWPWESGYPFSGAIVPIALGTVAAQVVSPRKAPPVSVPKRLRLNK